MGEKKKRQSGKRNADAIYRSWLKKTRILVEGEFVREWIEEAIKIREDAGDEGGVKMLAEILGVSFASFRDARLGRVRPDLRMVQQLAKLLGRDQELEELLPPPGIEGWGGETGAMYCGDGHPELLGCGSMFHKHFEEGLCEECACNWGNEGFEPRDVRWAQPNLMMRLA